MALDILGYFQEMEFVIKVIVFAYVMFWLYTTFSEVPVVFGISALIASYFLWAFAWPTIIFVFLFFAIIVFGNMLQQMLFFGLFPALNLLGMRTPAMGMGAAEAEMQELQDVERKIMQGKALSQREQEMYRHNLEQQMRSEQMKQQMMQRGGFRR
ncbi:MAG: hypothetical protein WC792_01305 [Candidatus Micrarchaeia archaeon]